MSTDGTVTVQYGYRYYDTGPIWPCPQTREKVLNMMRSDLSVVPIERADMGDGRWSDWYDSDELLAARDTPDNA